MERNDRNCVASHNCAVKAAKSPLVAYKHWPKKELNGLAKFEAYSEFLRHLVLLIVENSLTGTDVMRISNNILCRVSTAIID